MITQRISTNRDVTVECSFIPLPLGTRMRARVELILARLRWVFVAKT